VSIGISGVGIYIPEKIDSPKDETSSLTPYRSFEFDQIFVIVVIVFCCFLAAQYQQNKNTTNKHFFFKQTKTTHTGNRICNCTFAVMQVVVMNVATAIVTSRKKM